MISPPPLSNQFAAYIESACSLQVVHTRTDLSHSRANFAMFHPSPPPFPLLDSRDSLVLHNRFAEGEGSGRVARTRHLAPSAEIHPAPTANHQHTHTHTNGQGCMREKATNTHTHMIQLQFPSDHTDAQHPIITRCGTQNRINDANQLEDARHHLPKKNSQDSRAHSCEIRVS